MKSQGVALACLTSREHPERCKHVWDRLFAQRSFSEPRIWDLICVRRATAQVTSALPEAGCCHHRRGQGRTVSPRARPRQHSRRSGPSSTFGGQAAAVSSADNPPGQKAKRRSGADNADGSEIRDWRRGERQEGGPRRKKRGERQGGPRKASRRPGLGSTTGGPGPGSITGGHAPAAPSEAMPWQPPARRQHEQMRQRLQLETRNAYNAGGFTLKRRTAQPCFHPRAMSVDGAHHARTDGGARRRAAPQRPSESCAPWRTEPSRRRRATPRQRPNATPATPRSPRVCWRACGGSGRPGDRTEWRSWRPPVLCSGHAGATPTLGAEVVLARLGRRPSRASRGPHSR